MTKAAKETAQMLMPEETPKAPLGFEPQGTVRQVKAGTKTAELLDALHRGSSMEELVAVMSRTGSPTTASGVRSWIGYDVKRAGYGVTTDETGRLHLVIPKGASLVHKDASAKQAPVATIPTVEPEPEVKVAASPKRDRKAERARALAKKAAK